MKKIIFILIVVLVLNSCAKSSEISNSTARMLIGEEASETIKRYPETKTFAGGAYYTADLDKNGVEEIYILPWGSGIPIIHQLNYYDPFTDTFDTYESEGKAYWYLIYNDELYVVSPSDEYMMVYDNIESVYIPYLENGELKLNKADEDLEQEIIEYTSEEGNSVYGFWGELFNHFE